MQPTSRVKRDLTLKDVLAMLRRQRATIVVVLLLCFGLSAVAFKMTRATFRSSMGLMVDIRDSGGGSAEHSDAVATALAPAADIPISSQVQFIESQNFLEGVYSVAGGIGSYDPTDPHLPVIHAEQHGETNAVSIFVEAGDPFTVGKVLSAIPTVYKDYVRGHRVNNLTRGINFLNARLTRYTNDYKDKLAAVQSFKSNRKLTPLESESAARSNRVNETQVQETQAEASVAAAQQRVDSLKHEEVLLPKEDAVADVKDNHVEIDSQKQLLAQLEQQKAKLLTQWKEGTPPIIEIDAEIDSQRKRLAAIPPIVKDSDKTSRHPRQLAIEGQIGDAQVSLAAAKVELRKSQEAVGQAISDLKGYSALEPKQAVLVQAAAEAKQQMDDSSRRIEELQLEREAIGDSGSQFSPPGITEKIRPVLPQYIALAILVGIVMGVSLALLKDHIEDRVTSPQDVFQICGLEPLAQMPSLPASSALSASTALARHEANPALFDSYRLLRFNLLNAAERGYMGSLVVTSVTGSEGKSDLACDLAEVMASGGRRIILVDANLRNPSLAGHFSVSERPGLTDILVGDATLTQALAPTAIPGLMLLPAGAKTPNPVDLLESTQMVSLHSELREHADLIIFDAPSCLSYADVSVLASFTDSVLVVAEMGSTKRDLLNRGVQMLQRSSARLVGVVLRDKQLPRRTKRGKAA